MVQPAALTAARGSFVVLQAGAVGSPTPSYQWQRDGSNLPGATNATLVLRASERDEIESRLKADAVPEHHKAALPTPHAAHPGCFSTATLLASVPLLASGLTDVRLFVSGVTGSTGAGRSPTAGTHHPQRHSDLYSYNATTRGWTLVRSLLLYAAAGNATGDAILTSKIGRAHV